MLKLSLFKKFSVKAAGRLSIYRPQHQKRIHEKTIKTSFFKQYASSYRNLKIIPKNFYQQSPSFTFHSNAGFQFDEVFLLLSSFSEKSAHSLRELLQFLFRAFAQTSL